MPKINEMLLKLKYFQYATSLYLNIGYCHIRIIKNASNLCTIIIPWGKYRYKRLPMGFANPPEILLPRINGLFRVFKVIRSCMNELLSLTKGDWKDHVQNLDLTLNKMK